MNNVEFQKLLREQKERSSLLFKRKEKKLNRITEGRFPRAKFMKFFMDKMKKTGDYNDKDEMQNEAKFACDNMKYDMNQGDSLFSAFERACMDLHIESDGIENYL
jgi:hypothetical protein